jgi:hypothetical protein
MPYITRHRRQAIRGILTRILSNMPIGEFTYLVFKIILKMLKNNESYQRYTEILGALESMKLELYRRKMAHYEDTKMIVNGDLDDFASL